MVKFVRGLTCRLKATVRARSNYRLHSPNFFERGEFNPAACLRLTDLLEDVFRVVERRAFEERERARVLQRDADRREVRQNHPHH